MFRNSTEHSVWVSNADDPAVQQMVRNVAGRHLRFTLGAGAADAYFDRGRRQLVVLGDPLIGRDELSLLGDHNVANALAAALAVLGADETHARPAARARIAQALRAFRALEHRIEPAGCHAGVEWINDSKSTNVASTRVALQGMTKPTVLLLGGRHKGEPYDSLLPELQRTVKLVIAYGEAAPLIEHDLAGSVPLQRVIGSFEDVVAHARAAAVAGDAVLLSPACSSYDMFDNYEQRGRTFKRLAAGQGGAEG
jgi:UDP-N-acetylmuramoylalanine--D-glutamate ligase